MENSLLYGTMSRHTADQSGNPERDLAVHTHAVAWKRLNMPPKPQGKAGGVRGGTGSKPATTGSGASGKQVAFSSVFN